MRLNRLLRWAVAASVSTTLVSAVPAGAVVTHPAATHLVVHVSPATVLRGTLVTFSGSVSPRVLGVPVLVQRLVGKTWQTVAHEKLSAGGLLSFSLRAPRPTGGWVLRVVRASSSRTRSGVSATLHLRVVAKAFAVTAKGRNTLDQRVSVTGAVSLKATGSVLLQQLTGKTWHNLATAKLTHTTYSVSAKLAPGSHRLRVAKLFTKAIAGGLSKSFSVIVPTSPTVSSIALLPAMARRPYTAALSATGGVAPYTWTGSGLPAGLALAASGVVSGTPTQAATSVVTVTVADSSGRSGTASLALTVRATAGTAWAWGANDSSQLGNGLMTNTSAPSAVTGLTDATQIVGAGSSGGYALRADGTVAAWGASTYGALGNGTGANSNVPVAVSGLTGVTAVVAGIYLGQALKADGTVWSWGYGGAYQLGNGSTASSSVPVQATGLTGVTAIASGGGATYALRSDGTVWSWGTGSNGALGNGASTSSAVPVQVVSLSGVVAVAGGAASGYALKSDHTVWAWGWNGYGQLGDGTLVSRSSPVQVQGLNDVTSISGGSYAALALRADGTVWDWGFNQYGALGNNSTVNSSVPVAVSGLATVTTIAGGGQSGYAVKADGSAWAWGHNSVGQLGNGSTADSPIPVPVAVLTGIFAVSGGYANGYALNLG
jgi:alpha-tubulin suppressor-like RCC1 family protein